MHYTTFLVKNMVCHRCVLAVNSLLQTLEIAFSTVIPGEIQLSETICETQFEKLAAGLTAIGLELIDNRGAGMIEKIKQLIIKKARNEVNEEVRAMKLSVYLSVNLHHEYTYLSSLFSAIEGRTIETYFIEQRIEKAKELLVYNQMTISAIAFELEYSSTAHLCNQFKKITGLTASHFKRIGANKRKLLDRV